MFKSNGLEQNQYFRPGTLFSKSIQRSYNFSCVFLDNPFNKLGRRLEIGPMPIIASWHFKSVTLPTYKFKKTTMVFGQVPVSFPVLQVEDLENMQVVVDLEEDDLGTIEYFISWCQRSIIDDKGYYVPPLENRIGHLVVEVTDPAGLPIVYYTFKDLYYLDASPVTYSYDTSESVVRSVTFGVDKVETLFTKYALVNAAQKGISKVGNLIGLS